MRHIVLVKANKPDKFNYCKFGTYKNSKGKKIELIDPNGDVVSGYEMFQPILSLDLNDEDDKKIYDFLKDHPLLPGKFTIEDMRANEEVSAEKALKSAEAITVASSLNFNEVRDIAVLMGVSLDFDDMMIKAKVIQYSNNEPQKFLDMLNDIDKEYRIFLKRALQEDVLSKVNGVWKHGSNNVGLSDEQAIIWLKENADLYALLKHQLRTGEKVEIEEKTEEITDSDTPVTKSAAMKELMSGK